jgi:hypothetical protein
MKRIIYLAFVLVVILATLAGAQSLANVAKKEKERRVKNKASGKTTATRVIKEKELAEAKGKNLSVTGTAVTQESSDFDEFAIESLLQQSIPSAESSLEAMQQRRRQCEENLRIAEFNKKNHQAHFDLGVSASATIGVAGESKPPPNVRNDPDVEPVHVPFDGRDAIVTVGGTRIPCDLALKNPRRYPAQADQCLEIKKSIELAEIEIQRALECIRKR